MEIRNTFRILMIASAMFAIAATIYPELGIHQSSDELEVVLMWNGYGGVFPFHENDEWSLLAIIGIVAAALAFFAALAGLVGALFMKRWGRTLLAITALLAILSNLMWGVMVSLPLTMLFYEASGAMFYVAITMAFLPPLKHEFEKEPNK